MRIRKGDRIRYLSRDSDTLQVAMVCRVRSFPADRNHVGVRRSGCTMMEIIHRGDVYDVREKRESLQEWWKYL